MSKQTATEWLFKKLWDEPKDKLTWYAILKQAEEMHKEQIIDARVHGICEGIDIGYKPITEDISKNHEQYYNKTFKD